MASGAILIILTAFTAALIYVLSKIVAFWRKQMEFGRKLGRLVGPPSIPVLGSAHLFKWNSVEFSIQMEMWSREYLRSTIGTPTVGIMRIDVGPVPFVILCSYESIKLILESNTLITKPPQYDILKQWIGTGLLTSTNEKWFQRRKILTPTFHFTILNGYVPVFAKQARTFVTKLEPEADSGRVFDIFPYIKRCALDIICETAMGTEIGAQKGGNNTYVNAVARIGSLIWNYQRFPWLWLKPVWYLSGFGFEFDRLVKLTNDFTRGVIAERKGKFMETAASSIKDETKKQRLAFLDLLLQMQKDHQLTDEDIREEVDTFMFEGHDTTSSAMGFAIWYIGATPAAQEKLHAEMDEIFGDSDRLPNAEDLKKLVYLEMCIKESLRLMPSVPLIARKMSHDLKINEQVTLPEGMTVVLATIGASRDPRIYEDVDNFNPENFLPELQAKRDPYSFIPFSAGPRNCIGQKFALSEEKIVLSSFFRKYRVETMEPWPQNRALPEVVLKPSNGFQVKIYSRKM